VWIIGITGSGAGNRVTALRLSAGLNFSGIAPTRPRRRTSHGQLDMLVRQLAGTLALAD
jgi:hypothetical protein